MQWEEIVYDICVLCSENLGTLCWCLSILVFIYTRNKNDKELLKVEYASSPKKHKKHLVRKYYRNKSTGKTYIVEKHTNKNVISKSKWG